MNSVAARAGAVLAFVSFAASAQTQAPGLWEHSVIFKTQSGEMEKAMAEMQKQLAAMPPEQRKQMEQMMAGRGVGIGPKANTYKVCVTKEEAARQAGPSIGSIISATPPATSRIAGMSEQITGTPAPSSAAMAWAARSASLP